MPRSVSSFLMISAPAGSAANPAMASSNAASEPRITLDQQAYFATVMTTHHRFRPLPVEACRLRKGGGAVMSVTQGVSRQRGRLVIPVGAPAGRDANATDSPARNVLLPGLFLRRGPQDRHQPCGF